MKSLNEINRVTLGTFPTPIQKLENISRLLGTNVWVKRDDLTGIGLGGNKVRKLEFLKDAVSPMERQFPEPLADVSFTRAIQRATDAQDALEDLVPKLEAKGLGAKSRASLAVLNDFFPWVLEDSQRGMTNRAVREAREMAKVGERAVSRARAILEGRERDFPVPKYETGPIEISHAQTIGNRIWPDGRRDRGPVIQTGFGHFVNVQRLMHKLPPLGMGTVLAHGHTHIAELKTLACGLKIFNPGSISLPKGGSRRSFGYFDGKELKHLSID